MKNIKKLFKYNENTTIFFKKVLTKNNFVSTILNFILNSIRCFSIRCFNLFKYGTHPKDDNDNFNAFYSLPIAPQLKFSQFKNSVLAEYNKQDDFVDVTIVIPVFNKPDILQRMLNSLLVNTNKKIPIIFIDDCSSDLDTINLLERTKNSNSNITVIRNSKNLGFPKTVNYGMSLVKTRFAIWLNTDTIVPKMWVNRLLAPLIKYKHISSATPFTNAGNHFSYPSYFKNTSPSFNIDIIDDAFSLIKTDDYIRNVVCTGVGFCMAINMDCWKEIGPLDFSHFDRGYGEEYEWCFRAIKEGWINVLVPNLFIGHIHGGTFNSKEKLKLVAKHNKVLFHMYPKIFKEYFPRFSEADPLKSYRQIASLLLLDKKIRLVITSSADEFLTERENNAHANDVLFVVFSNNINKWIIHFNKKLDPDDANYIVLDCFNELFYLFNFLKVDSLDVKNICCNDIESALNGLTYLIEKFGAKTNLVIKNNNLLNKYILFKKFGLNEFINSNNFYASSSIVATVNAFLNKCNQITFYSNELYNQYTSHMELNKSKVVILNK